MKRITLAMLMVFVIAGHAGETRIDRVRLAAVKSLTSDQPGTSGAAFRTLAQKLAAAGYTPVPTHPRDLARGLPGIISFVQGRLDAKDAQLAAKQAEIVGHANANQFKQAFEKQIEWNNLMRQRCQLQDGYNEIQSWALALIIRKGARQ